MLNIGLTGGIGSGKSAVSTVLAELGATIVDADKIAREVVEPGTDGLAQIIAAFGSTMLDDEGALNRPALAQIVFNDDQARTTLNAIVHPRVRERSAQLVADAGPHAIIVHDIPLLAEGTMAPSFHLVLVVDTPVPTRLERLTGSRGMDRDDALARIKAQATDEQRLAIADVVLDNSGTPQQLREQIEEHWNRRLAPYADALAQRAPAEQRHQPRPGALERERARLAFALAQIDVPQAQHHDESSVVLGDQELIRPTLERAGWFGAQLLHPADPAGVLAVEISG